MHLYLYPTIVDYIEKTMPWTPIGTNNAIENARILFFFKEPLNDKLLIKIEKKVRDKIADLGFEVFVRPHDENTFIIQQTGLPIPSAGIALQKSGLVSKKLNEETGNLDEEYGFRKHVFGYFCQVYVGWTQFSNRISQIILPALELALDSVELDKIRLEYHNVFTREGKPSFDEQSEVLNMSEISLPEEIKLSGDCWHNYSGWFDSFEASEECRMLVQKNAAYCDWLLPDNVAARALRLHMMAEIQYFESIENANVIQLHIESAKQKLKSVFQRSLTEHYQSQIGLINEGQAA